MESQRASRTSGTRRNIFARAAHKVSKRLSKLFSRRNRQGEHNMTVSNQNVRENTSTSRNTQRESIRTPVSRDTREKEMILDEFVEKLPEKRGLYKVLTSKTVRNFINNNPHNNSVILLYSLAESYNKTPNEAIEKLVQRIARKIMKEIKASRQNNNFNKQLSISQRMVLKNKNNLNTAAYEAELAELLEKSSPQTQKGGMKQKIKTNMSKRTKMSKTLKKSRN
jgi:hypothetical protein